MNIKINKFIKDNIDSRILNYIQLQFPLVSEPFKAIGELMGIGEEETIRRIQNLKQHNIIRFISPVLDAQKLGYQTTLVAMVIPSRYLKVAERVIAGHPSISHAYWREHQYNLWITYAVPQNVSIDKEIDAFSQAVRSTDTLSLPSIRMFKRMAYFNMGIPGYDLSSHKPNTYLYSKGRAHLTSFERAILNLLQQDLPLMPLPYKGIADAAGMELEDFLSSCRSLMHRKIILRYGAAVNHRNIGYHANAMVCWKVPTEKLDNIAREIVKMDQVSHCYERNTGHNWPYNLYTMFHCQTRAICHDLVNRISVNAGLKDYLIIFSTREIKKVRIIYRV
jgi:DNA-binding Lrp family transcriptional regulator